MKNDMKNDMEKLFDLDNHVKDGVYCVGLTAEDMAAFAEHAKKRKSAKKIK